MPDDYALTELRKLQGHSYGILLWKGGNEKDVYLSDIVEATILDGHFILAVRGDKPFEIIDIRRVGEVDWRLYKKAKEIAIEKSRLYESLFFDSAF